MERPFALLCNNRVFHAFKDMVWGNMGAVHCLKVRSLLNQPVGPGAFLLF